jgi:hypothetical protein
MHAHIMHAHLEQRKGKKANTEGTQWAPTTGSIIVTFISCKILICTTCSKGTAPLRDKNKPMVCMSEQTAAKPKLFNNKLIAKLL